MTTKTGLPPVTDQLLDELEFRYADPRVCRVCGAPVQMTDSRGKWACTSDAASPFKGRYEKAGGTWKTALDHWQRSEMRNPPDGDLRVIALVREVRKLREVTSAFPAPGEESGDG